VREKGLHFALGVKHEDVYVCVAIRAEMHLKVIMRLQNGSLSNGHFRHGPVAVFSLTYDVDRKL
jgi:hypothetical protein